MATEDLDIDAGVDEVMSGLGEELTSGYKEEAPRADFDIERATVKSDTPVAPDTSAAAPTAAPPPQSPPDAPAVGADSAVAAPETWSTPEQQALWAAMSPTTQTFLAERETKLNAFVTEFKNTSDIGVRLGKTIEPFLQHYEANKIDPWQVMRDTLGAHAVLAFGKPEQKVAMFRALAEDAGIDVSQLGVAGNEAATGTVANLQQTVKNLENQLRTVTTGIQDTQRNELTDKILAFGDSPEHPHFWDLQEDITQLMASGVAKDLPSAYEKAVWANPRTRQLEVTRQSRERDAKLAAEATEKATKAKAASSVNLQSRPGSGRGLAAKPTSVDDTLLETLNAIHSRGD